MERHEKRQAHYLRTYGLTLAEYDQLAQGQEQACAICRRLPAPETFLFVDHDHRTKQVRGLVCHQCNTVLGVAHDNATVLRAAAGYLEGAKNAEPPLAAIRHVARHRRWVEPPPGSLVGFAYPCHPQVYPRQTDGRKSLWWRRCPTCQKSWFVRRLDQSRGFAFVPDWHENKS